MTEQTSNPSSDPDEANAPREPKKKGPPTLASGGMSPLADRNDAGAWEDSVDARPSADAASADPDDSAPTPAEPVGGWVEGSTGRGRISVRRRDARAGPRDPAQPEAPALAVGGTALGRPRSKDRNELRRRLERERAQARAEAEARERQEEARNQQDAMQDQAEDESYSQDDGEG